jgi:dihydrofolate reductase
MFVSCIAAMAKGNVIGSENNMPWHLPADLKHFKSITLSKPVIMGRKTFESIGKPLPGRRNIIVTRNADWKFEGVDVVHSLKNALQLAGQAGNDNQEIMVIGGGQIYREAMVVADRLYITEIDLETKGDAFFPEIDKSIWVEMNRVHHESAGDYPAYSFVTYERTH